MTTYLTGTLVLGADALDLFTADELRRYSDDLHATRTAGALVGAVVAGCAGVLLVGAPRVVGGVFGVVLGLPAGFLAGTAFIGYTMNRELKRRKRGQVRKVSADADAESVRYSVVE